MPKFNYLRILKFDKSGSLTVIFNVLLKLTQKVLSYTKHIYTTPRKVVSSILVPDKLKLKQQKWSKIKLVSSINWREKCLVLKINFMNVTKIKAYCQIFKLIWLIEPS